MYGALPVSSIRIMIIKLIYQIQLMSSPEVLVSESVTVNQKGFKLQSNIFPFPDFDDHGMIELWMIPELEHEIPEVALRIYRVDDQKYESRVMIDDLAITAEINLLNHNFVKQASFRLIVSRI